MHITTFGGLAALAASTAQAILIPPTISAADIKVVEVIPVAIAAETGGRILELDCPGCPIKGAKGGLSLWNQAQSKLRFNITVQHEESKEDALLFNDVQIFPVQNGDAMRSLHADQLVKGPDGKWVYAASPGLGFSLSVRRIHDGNQGMTLSDFHFRVFEVANTYVRDIPSIDLKIIMIPDGKLMIAGSQVGPHRTHPSQGDAKCHTALCRWKAIIADKVNAMKKGGCNGKKGSAWPGRHGRPDRPHRIPRPHGIKGGHPRPDGFAHPHHHHQRPHHNAFSRFLRALTFGVILPVLIGMGVGITASVVGMIVGHLIIFVWRMFFRRGERGQCARKQAVATEEDEDVEDETKGFLDHQGPPPVYEEAAVDEKALQQ